MVPKAIKSQRGGYDRTSGFDEYQTGTEASQNPADYIEYTQEAYNGKVWYHFSRIISGGVSYDNTITAPAGVDKFFDCENSIQ